MRCATCGRPVDNPALKGQYCSVKCARAGMAGQAEVVEKAETVEAVTIEAADVGRLEDAIPGLLDDDDV